jgi:LuxR family transcriptional regulator, quorum-sensing system regulator SdiA
MSLLDAMKAELSEIAPAGYYVALRVGFSFPDEELNLLPESWVEFYTAHGLVVHDPAMKWVYGNVGAARIEDIPDPDPQRIRAHAEIFGLAHGAVVSVMGAQDRGRRSYGLFYREDREFGQDDLAYLERIMYDLHAGSANDPGLTAAEIEALRLQASGLRLKQVAGELGISESAVKARLNNAKKKLGAKTLAQAASMAASKRIL